MFGRGVGWGGNDVHCYLQTKMMFWKYKLLAQCNHAKGIFSYTKKVGARKKVKVHTGGVAGFWNIMKKGVPKSLLSKPTKKIWCWENSAINLLEKTGKFASKL